MQLFENTKSEISEILKGNKKHEVKTFSARKLFEESFQKSLGPELSNFSGMNRALINIPDINILEYSDPKILLSVDNEPLLKLFGLNLWSFPEISIGSHPDFEHLQLEQYCYHYCVSMFVDIKGSTRLSSKYSLMDIRKIKDTLLSTVIQLVNFFGGHLQRLQGDGAMIQFVRVGQNPKDAIINALNAASILTYFVKNDLSQAFEENDVKPLRIRVGIDYGKDQQVIWSHYGLEKCTELTTTSLHTDLAGKLQQIAPSNGILIGENITSTLDLPDEFYNIFTRKNSDGTNNEFRYIFDSSYKMYQFDWSKYLLSHPNFVKSSNGYDVELQQSSKYSIKCEIAEPNSNDYKVYYANSFSIPKEYDIKFTLLENGVPYNFNPHVKIYWSAENRGNEAKEIGHVTHDFNKIYNNLNVCETKAAYLGHHYLKCKIENSAVGNTNLRFPVFVQ